MPVMIPTSEEEIKMHVLKQQKEKTKYPVVDENMKHSLRFWLAVHYYKDKSAENKPMCEYFGVPYGNVNRAKMDKSIASEYGFLSPAEKKGTSRKTLVDRFGTEEDKKKYNILGEWPEN